MVLKTNPEVSGLHLTGEIGAPVDYTKNKERGEFPEHYDLRIPRANSSSNDVNEADIAGALDDMNIGGKKQ